METWLRHLRARDWRFAGFLLANLVLIGLYLSATLGRPEQTGAGWRRIDTEAVQQRLESGTLSGREAQWYHPSTPDELKGGGERNGRSDL